MNRGKRPNNLIGVSNSKLYLDLKDIIRENALPFLPAKSLFRFQKVCRDWKLQISSPFFAHNQSLSFNTISGLFVQNPGEPPSFLSLDPEACGLPDPSLKFLPVPVDIKSSSNGLLCCQGRTGNKAYFICNPVTQQWKEIPKSDTDHGDDPAPVLVFKPSRMNFVAEYNIVCAFRSQDFDDAIEFDIYSSKEGTWKPSNEISFAFKRFMPQTGHYGDGVIYWPCSNTHSILAFDLENERSFTVGGGYRNIFDLGIVDGRLCSANLNYADISVVELSKYDCSNTMPMGSSSTSKGKGVRRHVVLDKGVVGNYTNGSCSVLFVGGNMVVVKIGTNLYSYDLSTGKTKSLASVSLSRGNCIHYVNSLASL